jgi:hypothetical protein
VSKLSIVKVTLGNSSSWVHIGGKLIQPLLSYVDAAQPSSAHDRQTAVGEGCRSTTIIRKLRIPRPLLSGYQNYTSMKFCWRILSKNASIVDFDYTEKWGLVAIVFIVKLKIETELSYHKCAYIFFRGLSYLRSFCWISLIAQKLLTSRLGWGTKPNKRYRDTQPNLRISRGRC